MSSTENDSGTQTTTKDRIKTEQPKQFKVLLLNDDYTPMDFVVSILESIFQKSPAEAVKIMLAVHHQGAGVCGIYPKQIAETKIYQVHEQARAHGHPLKSSMEEV